MKASIHNSGTRIVISFLVLVIVVLLIEPHVMDAEPPGYVKVLLWPASFLGAYVERALPHGNIGTAEHPVMEGNPLDFIAGLMLVFFCVFLYPVVTFVGLSVFSRFLKARR